MFACEQCVCVCVHSLHNILPAWIINSACVCGWMNTDVCEQCTSICPSMVYKSNRNNSFSWVREKSQSQKCSKIRRRKNRAIWTNSYTPERSDERVRLREVRKEITGKREKKINIGMWSVLFALLAIMLDYLFFSYSFTPLRLCIAFAIYCIHMSSDKSKKKASRTVCIFFLFTKMHVYVFIYIWIFMRTCFDSSCRSALAKSSCLSGLVRFHSHYCVCLIRILYRSANKELEYDEKFQRRKEILTITKEVCLLLMKLILFVC